MKKFFQILLIFISFTLIGNTIGYSQCCCQHINVHFVDSEGNAIFNNSDYKIKITNGNSEHSYTKAFDIIFPSYPYSEKWDSTMAFMLGSHCFTEKMVLKVNSKNGGTMKLTLLNVGDREFYLKNIQFVKGSYTLDVSELTKNYSYCDKDESSPRLSYGQDRKMANCFLKIEGNRFVQDTTDCIIEHTVSTKNDSINKIIQGEKQGYWVITGKMSNTFDFPRDSIYMEGLFIDNRKEGLWKAYYPNGNLKMEMTYLNNRVKGTVKKYHSNGVLKLSYVRKSGSTTNKGHYFLFSETGDTLIYEPYVELSANYNASNLKEEGEFLAEKTIWDSLYFGSYGVNLKAQSDTVGFQIKYREDGSIDAIGYFEYYGDDIYMMDGLRFSYNENGSYKCILIVRGRGARGFAPIGYSNDLEQNNIYNAQYRNW